MKTVLLLTWDFGPDPDAKPDISMSEYAGNLAGDMAGAEFKTNVAPEDPLDAGIFPDPDIPAHRYRIILVNGDAIIIERSVVDSLGAPMWRPLAAKTEPGHPNSADAASDALIAAALGELAKIAVRPGGIGPYSKTDVAITLDLGTFYVEPPPRQLLQWGVSTQSDAIMATECLKHSINGLADAIRAQKGD